MTQNNSGSVGGSCREESDRRTLVARIESKKRIEDKIKRGREDKKTQEPKRWN